MDPALKEYLDRMHLDLSNRSDAAVAQGHSLQKSQGALAMQLASQSVQLQDLALWKPDLEDRLAKLQETVADLQHARFHTTDPQGGRAAAPIAATNPISPLGDVHGQFGHGEALSSGGLPVSNSIWTLAPPVTGMFSFQVPLSERSIDPSLLASHIMAGLGANAPNMPFQPFNGDNPNLWKTLAEQYFHLFAIHDSYWVAMSILHFSGPAGIWLQSVQKKLIHLDWISFTSLLCTRFGHDRHQLLIRQFYSIKQTFTVSDYIERFDILMNHLVSYSDTTHHFFFLTRFIEGLRPDIRAVIMVQRPMDLDTACALALLQEEVAEGEIGSPPRTPEHKYIRLPSRAYSHFHHSNTTPMVNRSMDNRGQETAKMPADERLTALRNFRRAKGLCFKCGERWGQQHTCPTTVQMHIMEELLALFSEEDITGDCSADPVAEEQEVMCSISIHALRGVSSETSGVIQLHAFIAGMEVLILVDSGSSASFINKMLADKLAGAQQLQKPCTVIVADGS
uniref:Uncharacterized protein n=1 Tax=Avena sativa TaxID=4498 RepID=A0ACD5VZ87_AVESA